MVTNVCLYFVIWSLEVITSDPGSTFLNFYLTNYSDGGWEDDGFGGYKPVDWQYLLAPGLDQEEIPKH